MCVGKGGIPIVHSPQLTTVCCGTLGSRALASRGSQKNRRAMVGATTMSVVNMDMAGEGMVRGGGPWQKEVLRCCFCVFVFCERRALLCKNNITYF